MFAACLPQPVHQLPGSMLATGIRNALIASSYRAHTAKVFSLVNEAVSPIGKVARTDDRSADLELVALLRAMVENQLASEIPRVASQLPVHQPDCAGGQWCASAGDLVRFVGSEMTGPDHAAMLLACAGIPASRPWRKVRKDGELGRVEGAVWLTLGELVAVLPYLPGAKAVKLRRAMGG